MESLQVLTVLFRISLISAVFNPNTRDHDAYGVRMAVNDRLFALANSDDQTILVQMAPYNNASYAYRCLLYYPDRAHYIYALGVGAKQNVSAPAHFFYIGEVVPTDSTDVYEKKKNGTVISIMRNPNKGTSVPSFWCFYFKSPNSAYLSSYGHQEYFVMAVEPYGQYAIGLANDFVFRYQPFSNTTMTSKSSRTVWPAGSTFYPCAADASESFTIVAGFVKNSLQSEVRVTPTVYLMWNNDLTVLASWSYVAEENSWQSYLTYADIDTWSKKFTMSVKINGDDPTRVLIGMPFLNTVFLFRVTDNGTNLTMASSTSYDGSVGFGKSVTWLSSSQAAILYSAYSPDYSTWYPSKVYLYTSLNGTDLPASPTTVMPNAQQPLPLRIDAKFIRLISTPRSLAILDQAGGSMLFLSEPPGSYAASDLDSFQTGAIMPVFSISTPCIAGTVKADTGVHPCTPCPSGSRRSGQELATTCYNCSADAFCPLGAVHEIDQACLVSQSQSAAYPRTPELNVYEDLLIDSMVKLGTTPHCRRISAVFWTLILLLIMGLMLIGMASLNLCVAEQKRDRWRSMIKSFFLRTDLVVRSRRSQVISHSLRSSLM